MARRKKAISPVDPYAVLVERLKMLEGQVRTLTSAQMSHVQTASHERFIGPAQGMTMINWPTGYFCWYHDGEWICTPANPTHAIKVFGDSRATAAGDGAFKFDLEKDLDDFLLYDASAFLGTAASGPTIIQVSNRTRTLDLLTTRITIPAGATNSLSGTQPVVNTGGLATNPNNRVRMGDTIWIDVDTAGAGGKGLGVYLYYTKFPLPA